MSTHDQIEKNHGSLGVLRNKMADVIGRWTIGKEDCATSIPNLTFFRRERPTEPCACLVEPSIIIIVQGAKQLLIGDKAYAYNSDLFLITSLDLPASSQVLEASPDKPCLGLALKLDFRVVAELIAKNNQPPRRERVSGESAVPGPITPVLLEPFSRLLALLDEPGGAVTVLAPLVEREIHYRVLMSDLAARLWQIASVGSQVHRIARAIDWLKTAYVQPLRIDELAAHVQMSPSGLHHHFRQLTAMSPLQYQKWLRLNEARRLMLNEHTNVANAAFQVGYESPSQFSREYGRLFGASPKRDIESLRGRSDDASTPGD